MISLNGLIPFPNYPYVIRERNGLLGYSSLQFIFSFFQYKLYISLNFLLPRGVVNNSLKMRALDQRLFPQTASTCVLSIISLSSSSWRLRVILQVYACECKSEDQQTTLMRWWCQHALTTGLFYHILDSTRKQLVVDSNVNGWCLPLRLSQRLQCLQVV